MLRRLSGLIKGGAELPELIAALEDANEAERKIASGIAEIFGVSLKQFADLQPKEISSVLKSIQEQGKEQSDIYRGLADALATLPADLQGLGAYEREIARNQLAVKSADESLKRSEAELAKQEHNLKAAEETGSPDVAKFQAAVGAAKAKTETLKTQADKTREESNTECDESRKRFVDALTTSLRAAAEKRIEACNKLIELSESMLAPLEDLGSFDDVVLPKLKQKLSDLEHEIVE